MEALDTIFANGSATSAGPDFIGAVGFSDHNLIDNTAGSSGFSAASGDLLNVGANLAALGNNGGPTPTAPLLPGSPAIGAADAGVFTPQTIPGLVGWWRAEGSGVDATATAGWPGSPAAVPGRAVRRCKARWRCCWRAGRRASPWRTQAGRTRAARTSTCWAMAGCSRRGRAWPLPWSSRSEAPARAGITCPMR